MSIPKSLWTDIHPINIDKRQDTMLPRPSALRRQTTRYSFYRTGGKLRPGINKMKNFLFATLILTGITTITGGASAMSAQSVQTPETRTAQTADSATPAPQATEPGKDQSAGTPADNPPAPLQTSDAVTVTARRVEEEAQDVAIPLSVLSGDLIEKSGDFNVNRLKELIPTVQFYSTNPRNSAINIRGLGAPYGLTNDGIEPGVGLYIDGVFYARPASATLDFLDVERIEVLRGPQGTLFGKNTTAGAINVTTRRPSFTPTTDFEISGGSIGFIQAKASISGPLGKKVAARLSFSGTQRDGTLVNVVTNNDVNDLNNLGIRGQVMFTPSERIAITVAVDYTRQRAKCCTQVVAGVAPTLRPANRQYAQIASDLGYTAPSFNAFDRRTDVDTQIRSYQDLGGISLNIDWRVGSGQLTSTTAWRDWDWDPSNDRDFIGLPVTTISAGTSKQHQWTQEVRYAATINSHLNYVVGTFLYQQAIDSDPVIKQEQGSAAARFLLAPSAKASTPGLLDGYGFNQYLNYRNLSTALFGQAEWSITSRLHLLPGLRFNYDRKKVDFDQQVYGGLATTDPSLIALQQSIFAPQAYKADADNNNLSGQLTLSYKFTENMNAYATYATGYKSVGINTGGLPTDALGNPVLSAATVKPEDVHNYELGVKTTPFRNVTANLAAFDTEVKDFQAQVTNGSVGVIRGYLANAEKVRVRGAEFDGNAKVNANLSFYGAAAYTLAKYVTFTDAPPPIEDTGGPQFEDISGSLLPGISKWAASLGTEAVHQGSLLGKPGEFFAAADASYRSSFSSSATYSKYLVVPAYGLVNARVGFRAKDNWTVFAWSRNLLNEKYYELLTAAPGSSGLLVGQPGDPRTFGLTLRRSF
jgi:iron complex outermembrane recepter protein